MITAIGSLLVLGTTGCDNADDATSPATTATPASGVSPFDGQRIRTLRAADLAGYAQEARTAVAGRGLAAPETASESGMVPLSTAFASESRGGDEVSTHIVIADGDVSQQYVLYVDAATVTANRGGDDTYLVMDPDVFTPDPSDGQATSREVPMTNLTTGEEVVATISAEETKVDGEKVEVVVVEAVAVHDPAEEKDPNGGIFGDPSLDRAELGTPDDQGRIAAVALGVRSLRVNQNFDADGTANTKQEVQFTYQQTDNYGIELPRYNTARFDGSLFTTSSLSPVSGGTTTVQPVYTTFAGGVQRTLWYYAGDVNYSNTDYSFRSGQYFDCIYFNNNPRTDCTGIPGQTDFPVILLPTGNAAYRVAMNEDDYAVTQFSTRSGDYQGNVVTANFGTGGVQTLNTRFDANNHAVLSSDAIFYNSGIRQITANALFIAPEAAPRLAP